MKRSVGILSILILNGFLLNISEAALAVTSQQCAGSGQTPNGGAPPHRTSCCPGFVELRLDNEGGRGACAKVACDSKAYGRYNDELDYRINVLYTETQIQVLKISKNNKVEVLILDKELYKQKEKYSAQLQIVGQSTEENSIKDPCKSYLTEGANKLTIGLHKNKTMIDLTQGNSKSCFPGFAAQCSSEPSYFECSDPGFTKVVMHPTCVNDTLYKEASTKQGSSKQ